MGQSKHHPIPRSTPFPLRWLILLLLLPAVVFAQAADEEEASTPAGDALEGEASSFDKEAAGTPVRPEPESEPAAEEAPAHASTEKDRAWEVDGYLRSSLRFRSADGENDGDLFADLLTDVKGTKGKNPWSFRFFGRLHWDFIGDQENDPTAMLRDVWDNYGGAAQVQVYEVFAKVDNLGKQGNSLTLGRQFIDDGIWLQFDGARYDWIIDPSQGLDLSLFGGVPVLLWTENAWSDGNWSVGLVGRWKPGKQTRLRLEYYHISQYFAGINDGINDPTVAPVVIPATRLNDDFLGFSVWHDFNPATHVYGRFTLLEGDPNELELRARWRSKDGKWLVVADWYNLFTRLTNVTNDLTPYVPMMGVYEPFGKLGGRATYRPNDRWVLQGGLAYRALFDEIDEGTYNREYTYYYFTVSVLDLADQHMDITANAIGYAASGGSDVATITGDIAWRFDEKWRASIGIDYQLYKYDYLQNAEREDVYTYYLRVRWKATKTQEASLLFSIDDDRYTEWISLFLYWTWRF